MTAPEPDGPDQTRPDPAGRDAGGARRPDLPEDVDAAFASIVADWAADGAPRWPDEAPDVPEAPRPATDPRDDGPSSGLGTATPPGGQPAPRDLPGRRAPRPGTGPRVDPPVPDARRSPPARPTEDEHYVPPDPPPLPRLGLSSLLGIGLLIVGVVLLAVPGLLGGPIGLGIVPGLLAMTAGLGWLVFGLRRGRGSDDGSDDGAIL
ncbi:hypothetical protein Acsp06_35840 [Actinomycetospora sp. NBRC 106375]|uniref:hypothetical protein n=1 Tax=Actinomycetospora sp. NBRC 106375 TaxID=3032207 RepID=UPI0024A02841|nr:hypothetical protein [Actinomycetospora sp. NBRC 106375]GLZ47399.1 hypothetical protein Acsp06_35840 [Actinomycetospora sp. NBRC 106375]